MVKAICGLAARFGKAAWEWIGPMLPTGRDNWRQFGIKLVYLVLIFCLIVTPLYGGGALAGLNRNRQQLEALRQRYYNTDPTQRFALMKKENADYFGWLRIDGIAVETPVFQSKTRDYTAYNTEKKRSRYGTAVMDGNDSANLTDLRWTITAKTCAGAPFESLTDLRDSRNFLKNPTIYFQSERGAWYFSIFAVLVVAENDTVYRRESFADTAAFEKWLNQLESQSIVKAELLPGESDRILTLVCDADDFDGAQLVIMATTAENGSLSVNPNPQFCKEWYVAHHLSDTKQ